MTSLFGSPASGEIEGQNNEVIREICYTHSVPMPFKDELIRVFHFKIYWIGYNMNSNLTFENTESINYT